MSENKKREEGKDLEDKELDTVSGGAINERTEKYGFLNLGKRKVYDVTRDDTGEVIKTYRDVSQASNLDKYANTGKKG